MANSKQGIIQAIENKISGSKYDIWRVGITADWPKRKKAWGDSGESVQYWTCWEAASSTDAKDIESHFINKGMKGGTGGDLSAQTKFVYVF